MKIFLVSCSHCPLNPTVGSCLSTLCPILFAVVLNAINFWLYPFGPCQISHLIVLGLRLESMCKI